MDIEQGKIRNYRHEYGYARHWMEAWITRWQAGPRGMHNQYHTWNRNKLVKKLGENAFSVMLSGIDAREIVVHGRFIRVKGVLGSPTHCTLCKHGIIRMVDIV